jgi:hypothetical protein
VFRGEVLSLCLVIAGAVAVPLGLRAVNAMLPGAAGSTYLPTIETPRPREPFDAAAAAAVRETQPEFVVIGDSMAGIRIDPRYLTRITGRSVVGLFTPGTPVAYWYLQLKNVVADNGLTNVRGVILFFRDDQLTAQVEVNGPILDPVARDEEPELDRILAAYRLGPLSDVHRAARTVYQFDRTRLWLEPRLTRAPSAVALQARSAFAQGATADRETTADMLLNAINTEIFALDKLRNFAAADRPQAQEEFLDFDTQVDRSLLPAILDVAGRAGIRLAFIRVQRRPKADGPPDQSAALAEYVARLKAYVEERGAYFHDDRGDVEQPLAIYADGDHLRTDERPRYTERFARTHARFFQ